MGRHKLVGCISKTSKVFERGASAGWSGDLSDSS